MFTLWYSVLSWKEYSDIILGKVSEKLAPYRSSKQKPTTLSVPKVEPPKSPQSIPKPPSPQPVPKPISQQIPASPQPIPKPPQSIPKPVSPPPPPSIPAKLDPPAKPPRSPSPHPLRTEAFDDIEYEEEESEEDEDSVVDATKPTSSVNDFINMEINQQRRDFNSQRYNENAKRDESN